MPSTKKGKGANERSVRFAAASTENNGGGGNNDAVDGQIGGHRQGKKRRLEKDRRMNEDELDDVDEWNPDEDNDNDDGCDNDDIVAVNESGIIDAKRQRRTKRAVGKNDDEIDTRVDNRTSLAAEGYAIEPFNMEQERNDGSGYFDGDTYVFRKANNDEDDEPDAWVDSLKDDMSKTDDNNAMQREERRRKQITDDADEKMDNWKVEDLYTKLLPHLEGENETVMAALIRYGRIFQVKHSTKGNNSNNKVDTSHTAEDRQIAQDSFNIVTEAANALLLKGTIDIYDTKRIDIEAQIKSTFPPIAAISDVLSDDTAASSPNNNTAAAAAVVQWEYRGNRDGQIQGPFSTEVMLGWINDGYFIGSMAVQVRTIISQQQPSSTNDRSMKDDLLSDLLNDDEDNDKHAEQLVERGEWILSDKIDFHKYRYLT